MQGGGSFYFASGGGRSYPPDFADTPIPRGGYSQECQAARQPGILPYFPFIQDYTFNHLRIFKA